MNSRHWIVAFSLLAGPAFGAEALIGVSPTAEAPSPTAAAVAAVQESPTAVPAPVAEKQADDAESDEILVIAHRSAGSGSVLGQSSLDALASGEQLGTVLNREGGVDLQGQDSVSAFQKVALRGHAAKDTVLLLNGQRLSPGFDLGSIPGSNVERVEILKGPTALAYGSDAEGGIINVVTKEPKAAKGSLNMELGDFSTHLIHAGSPDLKLGSWSGGLVGAYAKTDGYAFNTDEQSWNLGQSNRWHLGQDNLDLKVDYLQKFGGMPDAENLVAQGSGQFDPDGREEKWALTSSTEYSHQGRGWTLIPQFSYDLSDVLHLNPFGEDVPSGPNDPRRDQRYNLEGRINFSLQGAEGRRPLDLVAESREEYDASGSFGWRQRNVSAFTIKEGLKGSVLDLDWSGRLDQVEGFAAAFNPAMTLTWRPTQGAQVHVGGGTGYRVPGFDDLYHPTLAYPPAILVEFGAGEKGNPELVPERSVNWELGADIEAGSLNIQAAGFTSIFTDMIQVEKDEEDEFWTSVNVTHATVYGGEASLAWSPKAWFRPYASYTYVQARETENQEDLAGRLRQKITGGLEITAPYGLDFEVHESYLERNPVESEEKSDQGSPSMAVPYSDLGASLKARFSKILSISISVSNALDQQYATLQGLPMRGRFAKTGVKLEF